VKRNPHPPSAQEVLRRLRALGTTRGRAAYAYFGCTPTKALGVPAPALHRLAGQLGRNHRLAEQLWATGVHEARTLAALVDEPQRVTRRQMERWARDFDSWDMVDSCCCYLFPYTRHAWKVIAPWSRRQEEFVKRAAFAQLAYLAYKDKSASDEQFARHLPLIRRHATDHRNFVKKAVNWALRNIGKRNRRLNAAAIRTAQQIRTQVAPACKDAQGRTAALWCAADALRELQSPAVQRRLHA
jgi:3-methyladenine DNA glycosylase AlkD